MKLMLIHPYREAVEIICAPDRNCPDNYAYLVPDGTNFVELARSRYEIEKDRNEWIRRYENVLNGLKYWREKALENEDLRLPFP